MPSKLINNTLSSLSSGVSEQYEAGRFDSQVEQMNNCIPSITRGVLRRNPLVSVNDLSTGDLTNAFVYTYDRGTADEQYIFIVKGDGSMQIYNINTGTLIYSTTGQAYLQAPVGYLARDIFKAITIGDHSFIVNNTIQTSYTTDVTSFDGYSDMAFYWIKKTTSVVTAQYQTGAGTSGDAVSTGSATKGYDYTLNNVVVNAGADTRPNETQFDINKATLIAKEFVSPSAIATPTIPEMTSNTAPAGTATASSTYNAYGAYLQPYLALSNNVDGAGNSYWGASTYAPGWLAYEHAAAKTIGAYSIRPSTEGAIGQSAPKDWVIQGSNDGISWNTIHTMSNYTGWSGTEQRTFECTTITSYAHHRIYITSITGRWYPALTEFQLYELGATYSTLSQATDIEVDGSGNPTSSICYTNETPTKWDWEDSFGNQASRGVWQTVPDSEELPATLPRDLDEFKVKVNGNTTSDLDDYFLMYNHASKSWKETTAGGINYKLDGSTMPHVVYRLANGGFMFDEFKQIISAGIDLGDSAWGQRVVGGADLSTEDPSFIGQAINNIFFYKNRLGFMTNDNVIFSRTGDYGNFFLKTLQDVLDDDPIDLAVASTDVSLLRTANVLGGNLVIFSDDTQFVIPAIDNTFTSKTAQISPLSNYTYNKTADANTIGNRIYFSSTAGNYSQIYTYQVSDRGSQITEGTPRTIHLPTYIDSSIYQITGHDVLGYTFFTTQDSPKDIVVLSSLSKGAEDLQNAFHKWTFTKNILSTNIINNDLYILFIDGDLGKISLEVPGSISNTSYLDEYLTIAESYTSFIEFSKFYFRDANGKGTERGRYQLRTMLHDITDDSYYKTIINNTDFTIELDDTHFGTTWVDTDVWDDTLIWTDINPAYLREYTDDDKVTIMGNNKNIRIIFTSSTENPSKGFELATTNIEALFHQRSSRT